MIYRLYHLIFTIALGNRYHYSYFINEEIDTEVIKHAQAILSVTGRARTKTYLQFRIPYSFHKSERFNQPSLQCQFRVFIIKYGDHRGQWFLEHQEFLELHNYLELC